MVLIPFMKACNQNVISNSKYIWHATEYFIYVLLEYVSHSVCSEGQSYELVPAKWKEKVVKQDDFSFSFRL